MRILRIGGRNLASLAEEFSVDFEAAPLAASGLFAISGPTGAGKSTLLDALCLALYGATPRLKTGRSGALVPDAGGEAVAAGDPRSLLRRGAADGHAEVDFVGNDGLRYRARWSVRRAYTRATGALQPAAMSLHRLPDLVPIGAKRTETAEEIRLRIGLSFEQFTRAVLLAQNEFAAFLKTDENERGELLETLTGSTIYSTLSKRAFERYKSEQERLRQLTARLADQAPLDASARAALEADCASADAALGALETRQRELDQLARWVQAADALSAGVASAETALQQSQADALAAAPRRARLATLAAVEEARPLQAELARLAQEQAALQAALGAAQNAQASAVASEQQAATAATGAAAALAAAEQAAIEARPLLDQAKALDAAIAALAPAHEQALAARTRSSAALDDAQAELQRIDGELAGARQAHAEGAAWLADNSALAPLARQWPRWDSLLQQADSARTEAQALSAQLAGAEHAAQAAQAKAARLADSAQAQAVSLREADSARRAASEALARFDGAALRSRRAALTAEREAVSGARQLWRRLHELRQRGAALATQLAEAGAEHASAGAALGESDQAAPLLGAAATQAETSLRAAELACADSVEDLRGQLEDDAPCPVCGAHEHPYAHASPALHAVLAQLREQVARCREAASANLARQASAKARLAAAAAQSARLRGQIDTLEAERQPLEQQWQALPLAAGLVASADASFADGIDDDSVLASCDQQLAALAAQLAELEAAEESARQAVAARDAAQAAFDAASSGHASTNEAAAAARLAANESRAAHAALADRAASAGASLAALLDDLDGAFALDDALVLEGELFADTSASNARDWRAQWHAAPSRFHRDQAEQARQFNAQAEAQPHRLAAMSTLQVQHAAGVAARAQAARLAAEAETALARHAGDIAARRQQRASLWPGAGGETVALVEARLHGAVDAARAALAARHLEGEQARLAAARARDHAAQLGERIAAGSEQHQQAGQALAQWLDAFAARASAGRPEGADDDAVDADIIDANTLATLLAVPAAERRAESAAIAALDSAVASAATVLGERRQQHAQHLALQPAGTLERLADSLAADLAQLAESKTVASASAAALRAQLVQDELRRSNAQAALAGIERQRENEQRWGKLSELIGSADGKKFRNYAQQFTLDVLLGYANVHLGQLAKRYRLERVAGGAGPSLGLMVRDQDMGGEMRGVNSLSGGESFLVSLALALGLASLSSNRVKVESLFIDEGFGSLDSETLRVAMDALDGLQALGRKVGVISHVQEMTERIATRIVVQPSGAGSSSVTVQ